MLEPRDMETHKRVPYSFGVERIHVFFFWQKRKNRRVTFETENWGVEYLLPPIFLHGLYNWCSTLQRCEAYEEVYQGKVYKSDGCYLPPAWRMVFKAAHTATRKKREQRHTIWETGGSIWYHLIFDCFTLFHHIPWFFSRSFNVLTESLDSSCATSTMAFEVVMLLSFYWWHQEFSEIAGDEEVSLSTNERTCLQQIPLPPLVPHNKGFRWYWFVLTEGICSSSVVPSLGHGRDNCRAGLNGGPTMWAFGARTRTQKHRVHIKIIKKIFSFSSFSGWWFQRFFIFTSIWGRLPFWRMFFKGVETINQFSSFSRNSHGLTDDFWWLSIELWKNELAWSGWFSGQAWSWSKPCQSDTPCPPLLVPGIEADGTGDEKKRRANLWQKASNLKVCEALSWSLVLWVTFANKCSWWGSKTQIFAEMRRFFGQSFHVAFFW